MAIHRPIHKMSIDGIIGDDKDIPKTRTEVERLLVQDQRDAGRVPVLDIPPAFTLVWDTKAYHYTLTMYFQFVGKKQAYKIEGITCNRKL